MTMLMDSPDYIDPKLEDILLTDLSEDDLKLGIANRFEIGYLTEATSPPVFPVSGILFGNNLRAIVPLVVKLKLVKLVLLIRI